MSCPTIRGPGAGHVALLLLGTLAAPACAQGQPASMADVLSGAAVPQTIKLKELTPDWRRVTVSGATMLGTEATVQAWSQMFSSLMGGAAANALFTRGATVKIGDEQLLIAYRLPIQGIDLRRTMAAAAAADQPPGIPPKVPPLPPITPETELSLVLVNLRAIGSISDVRPFNLAEVMQPAPPSPPASAFGGPGGTARKLTDEFDLRELDEAVMRYAHDHDHTLPPMGRPAALKLALMPYVKKESGFYWSASRRPYLPNPHLSGRRLAQLKNRATTILLYAPGSEEDGSRLVVYLDSEIRALTQAEWAAQARRDGLPVR